jgi:hypothetical protein
MAEADTLTAMAGIRLAVGDAEGAAGFWGRAASIVEEVTRPRIHCSYLEDVRRRLSDAGVGEERIPLPSCWS